jgi:hypothetical protein
VWSVGGETRIAVSLVWDSRDYMVYVNCRELSRGFVGIGLANSRDRDEPRTYNITGWVATKNWGVEGPGKDFVVRESLRMESWGRE